MFEKSVVESVGKCVGEQYSVKTKKQGSLGSPPKKLRIEIVMGGANAFQNKREQ